MLVTPGPGCVVDWHANDDGVTGLLPVLRVVRVHGLAAADEATGGTHAQRSLDATNLADLRLRLHACRPKLAQVVAILFEHDSLLFSRESDTGLMAVNRNAGNVRV